jgi:hypothetical protein
MDKKSYECICHICGNHHVIVCEFLSTGTSIVRDGIDYPAASCGKHTREELRAAFAK